jgi:hypothetical protein
MLPRVGQVVNLRRVGNLPTWRRLTTGAQDAILPYKSHAR